MDNKVRELFAERANLVGQMRALLDKADGEKRAMSADENTNYANMEARVDQIEKDIEKRKKQALLDESLRTGADAFKPIPDGKPTEKRFFEYRGQKIELPSDSRDQDTAFNSFLRKGNKALTEGEFRTLEKRALQADADIYGGFLVAPSQFVLRLIQAVDNLVFVRSMATVFPVTKSESLGAPSLDNDPADPAWTAEIATGTEDSTMSFGRRELTPHPLAKLIKISEKLLRVSAMDVESLVIQRLAYKFAVVMENNFLNGTGSNSPMGVFTAAAAGLGISTGRDVSTGNTATAVTFDGLLEALYSLKAQYHPKATWMFHRDGIKKARKLKDGDGQYIWQPSVQLGAPDLLLGRPYKMSEYVPNTWTTGLYVGIIGDFTHYWIADALDMRIQRLNELYAATNQVGFIARQESDGMPVLEEAFARVKLA